MPLIQKTYWHTTVRMPGDSNLTPLPEKVDVAIIGGGYTGLSAARTLAVHGVARLFLKQRSSGGAPVRATVAWC